MSVNGLNKITEKILADAREESKRILEQARKDCKKISDDYASQAEQIREKLSVQAEQKATDMIARARSAAAMRKRNILMQQQSDLIDSVFGGAREWVLSLDNEKYTDLLAGLLSAALFELVDTELKNRAIYGDEDEPVNADYEVLFNKKDRDRCGNAVLDAARKKLTGKIPQERLTRMKLSDQTVVIDGGLILRWGDVECNCSFELLFAQLHRELEGEVSQALFEVRGMNG